MKPKHSDHGNAGIVLKLIRWLSPVDETSQARLTEKHWDDVNAEFASHQQIAEFLCLAGMFAGILIPAMFFRPFQPWDVGIMFGAMIAAPIVYVFAVCAAKGFEATYSRWSDFSTMKYAIPWRTQFWYMYVPMIIVGIACVAGRVCLPIVLE